MNRKTLAAAVMSVTLLAACKQTGTTENNKPDMLATDRDTTVNPADDFFNYSNGGWIKANPIPNDETTWGIGHLVNEELYKRKLKINEDAMAKNAKDGADQKIGDFWFTGMDTVNIEKNGLAPLKGELDKISAMQNLKDVMAEAARLQVDGVEAFYGQGVSQDSKASDVNAYYLSQGGLGLPNRDYYFNKDARTTHIREEYPKFLKKMLVLMGVDSTQAEARAAAVMAMETKLADKSRKLEDLRDPYANYNKMAITDLHKISPTIDWAAELKAIGVTKIDSVIVGQPEFYTRLDEVLGKENIQTLKDYMGLRLVSAYAGTLSTPFVNASFDFYGKILHGAKEMRPRWKRVLDVQESAMGELVGKLFAKEYFNEKAKKRYEDIVENMRNAYKARIEKLTWMSPETKKFAIMKLTTMRKKVGYPDKWKDFTSMNIGRTSYTENMIHANEFWNQYGLNKLGKPVDRDEWDMTPQTYNAYYNPSNNEIVLPAGQFTVPGYMDNELDDALVYGYAAASTVGHEMTHGFDDQGRQFDEKGNLHNWWTSSDSAQFAQHAQVLVNQFNGMIAVDSLHINGKASLGENLADLGGILIGIDAFKQTEFYKKNEKISGMTPMQRFFLGYALGWLMEIRNEQLASQILTDVHAPAKFRVNGPMANVPDFYEAFNVKPGNKLYLPDSMRVHLW
jgi:putative endopeptidase